MSNLPLRRSDIRLILGLEEGEACEDSYGNGWLRCEGDWKFSPDPEEPDRGATYYSQEEIEELEA